MIQKLELFLIRFTIPVLPNEKFFKDKLLKHYLNLKKIVDINAKLISGFSIHSKELYFIRKYFLARIKPAVGEADAIGLLPLPLRDVPSIPTLKSLTINFLRNRMKKDYKEYKKNEREDYYLGKELKVLPADLKEELKNELEHTYDKIIIPFGTLSPEDAHDIFTTICKLIAVELKGEKFNTRQILSMLKIALVGYMPVEKYFNMLPEIKGCARELRNALYWAIRRNRADVYNKLLQIKSDFKITDHVEYLLPFAIEYANSEIYESLLEISDISKLLEKTFLLHSAAQSRSSTIVNKFLKLQFDPKRRDRKEWLPIHYAVKEGDLKIYNLLLPYVQHDLNQLDHFNLFYSAAIKGHLEIMQHLVREGLNLTVTNSEGKTLLETVNAKLNEHMSIEIKHWGAVFLSYDKLHRVIKFLQVNTPTETTAISADQPAMTIKYSQMAAEQNTRLIENVEDIVNHPSIVDNLSIYNRYFNGTKIKESIFITFFTLFFLTLFFSTVIGGITKYNANSRDIDTEGDHRGNVLLTVSGVLFLAGVCILMGVCLPKNKIPCTHFFRNNPRDGGRNSSAEEMQQLIP